MIITRPKPFAEIQSALQGKEKIFLIGCGLCATLCQSGGQEQVIRMRDRLVQEEGKEITGLAVLEAVCHVLRSKKELRAHRAELSASEAILVMACGGGVQAVGKLLTTAPVVAALDSLFLGNIERFGQFEERCSLCGGDCILNKTGGICPLTACSKGLLNGPCGGMKDGRCELDRQRDCAWVLIYERLKATGGAEAAALTIRGPRDHSQGLRPRRLVVDRPGVEK
ncbi:MAG: methylenetetrahydrofolate reductase C-terminal domain-containing protein [bacterium]|nr:methylenetetrahydrofolate reductase C-terminal domain-containing protein [bacterium]